VPEANAFGYKAAALDLSRRFRFIGFWKSGSIANEEPMCKSPLTDEHIVAMLREAARTSVAKAARLSAQYSRHGYRRIRIFLRRVGLEMGVNRAPLVALGKLCIAPGVIAIV